MRGFTWGTLSLLSVWGGTACTTSTDIASTSDAAGDGGAVNAGTGGMSNGGAVNAGIGGMSNGGAVNAGTGGTSSGGAVDAGTGGIDSAGAAGCSGAACNEPITCVAGGTAYPVGALVGRCVCLADGSIGHCVDGPPDPVTCTKDGVTYQVGDVVGRCLCLADGTIGHCTGANL